MLSTINNEEEKTYNICLLSGYCIFVVFNEISLFTGLSVLCNWLKYEMFTVGL